jgi:GNAT superfamily N-acetyltransferase
MGQPLIRRATVSDVEAGAQCHANCWQEAYAGIVDPTRLAEATADVPARSRRWQTAIEDGAERWLAMHPDGDDVPVTECVVGFAAPGMSRDSDGPRVLEVYAIYVRKAWWGTGLGGRLLEVAVGDEPALLWVLEANARARAFYARHGFRPDGARKLDPVFGEPEIRMVR